uniref:Uncharacterized protein n=1 Tax=Oryza sativa subsp. japonica TaxID=39947 RepID=Q6Z0W4_ORYSJ|nr:hypothetical protein [Oryza sativa Japonica Group]
MEAARMTSVIGAGFKTLYLYDSNDDDYYENGDKEEGMEAKAEAERRPRSP